MRVLASFLCVFFFFGRAEAKEPICMTDTSYLRNANGKIIGKVVPVRDYFQARLATGRTLGRYFPRLDRTYTATGKLVGHGNWLSALILIAAAEER